MAQHNAAGELPARTLETVPAKARLAIILLLVLGSATLLTALLTDAARAWRAYLFNWLYWTSIAQGAVILAAAVTMTRGIWSQPVRRIALSFVAFLPVSFLLLLPLLFAAGQVFPWVHQELGGKEAWLNVPFLAARNLAGLATLFGLSLAFAYWALRPDAGLLLAQASPRHSGPECRGLYARLTRGWQGQEVEEARAHRNLSRLSPVLALTYAIVFSIVAVDFVMSLEPEWFSSLIGPYFFMAAFLGGIAATALLTVVYRRGLELGSAIQPPQLHDLGKLTFA
ncbi:MAG: hypothetical protein HY703_05115, partial [Gemmatimonadetes bacterium]|nr:hypothetical protein [Gemmatimonadota bacterium]